MSTAPSVKKYYKEFLVLEVANAAELRVRLNDQSGQGLNLEQVVPLVHTPGFLLILSRETPFKPTAQSALEDAPIPIPGNDDWQ